MAASTSRLSYVDCYEIMDQALANTVGIRLPISDQGAGKHLRTRLHQARSIDRQDNKATWPEGHRLYGRSVYDCLVCRIKEDAGKDWLYIEKWSAGSLNIEPLGEDNGEQQVTHGDRGEAGGEGESQPSQGESEEVSFAQAPSPDEVYDINIFDQEEAQAPPQAKRRM